MQPVSFQHFVPECFHVTTTKHERVEFNRFSKRARGECKGLARHLSCTNSGIRETQRLRQRLPERRIEDQSFLVSLPRSDF